MRAVNLVPPEARTGRVSAGKSGGAVYGFLGGLVVLLIALSVLATTHKQKAAAEAELAQVQQDTAAFERVASHYAVFAKSSEQVQQRIAVVRGLSEARFDWAGSLRELSRLVPANVQISNLGASVRDGVGGDGGASRPALAVPAISISGCTVDQSTVADLITRLQAMRRVQNVTLESSATTDEATASSSSSGGGSQESSGQSTDGAGGNTEDGCSLKKPNYQFALTVFYAPGNSQPSTDATGGTTPAAASPASSVTPSTSTSAGN